MSSEPKLLHKEWGLLPLALSGIAIISVIILSIYYSNQSVSTAIYKNGIHIQCDRSVAALVNAILFTYKYPGAVLIIISFASVILCYIYDRGMFLFVVVCFVIFNYPFVAIFKQSKFILSESSVETLCARGNYGSVVMQIPIMFLASYVIIGNVVLLAKRWLRGRTKNG